MKKQMAIVSRHQFVGQPIGRLLASWTRLDSVCVRSHLSGVSGLVLVMIVAAPTAQAGSATWNLDPISEDWNTAANWTPNTVPDGPTDTATFSVSNHPKISVSTSVEVRKIVFALGATRFNITCKGQGITLSGPGVTNNSGITQRFDSTLRRTAPGQILFMNSATAGDGVTYRVVSPYPIPGMLFLGSSTAGSCRIFNNSSPDNVLGGDVTFAENSTAGTAIITNNGGLFSGGQGANTDFLSPATAGNATLIAHGGTVNGALGGSVSFGNGAHAGDATLIADGGAPGADGGFIDFFGVATGDRARVELRDTGSLDLTPLTTGLTIGSLEGNGSVILASHSLTIGSNNRSTIFRGVIQGTGGLTKIGPGRLTLSGASSYTGTTAVESGNLVVHNGSGSATGTGPVHVDAGVLSGTGMIAGAVTVGDGTGAAAALSPGIGTGLGALTVEQSLTFNADGSYNFALDSGAVVADQVSAQGVTINAGAAFTATDRGGAALPPGTTFIVLSNTSGTSISGAFGNLPDGGTIVIGANTFQANYEGGDGNDLALTVVP